MSWTTFAVAILLAYLLYYLMNILYDRWAAGKVPGQDTGDEKLYFEDDVVPELITLEEREEASAQESSSERVMQQAPLTAISSQVESTGAVGIGELMRLAKENLIEHTRAISY